MLAQHPRIGSHYDVCEVATAPEFFDDSKSRPGSADAGPKGDGGTKSVGQAFNDAIRNAAGYKVN